MKRRLFYASSVAASWAVAAVFVHPPVVGAQSRSLEAKASAVAAPRKADPKSGASATPRLANGKPDLNGIWDSAYTLDMYHIPVEASAYVTPTIVQLDKKLAGAQKFADADDRATGTIINTRRCAPSQHEVRKAQGRDQCDEGTNEYIDSELTTRMDPNRPLYKPEYWTKVQDLDYDANNQDPQMVCQSLGVPRMGPPAKIVQTAKEVIFFYPRDEFRLIPIDGRGHSPKADPTFRGDSVGHWDGDTLVVDVTSFNDRSWLAGGLAGDGGGGYFHSYEMHVIERLTRKGDRMIYQATVEDPEVFLEPWKKNPVELKLNTDPAATVLEAVPCNMEYDKSTIVGRNRH